MSSFYFLFIFYQASLFIIGKTLNARILSSPCPRVFTYEKMNYNNNYDWIFPSENQRWRGVVRVTPVLPIYLKIKLLVPAPLQSKYVGKIEVAEGKDEVVKKIKKGNLEKIKYYIYFPSKVPVPELLLIKVNSRIVCSVIPVPRRIRTILTLEHSLVAYDTNIEARTSLISLNQSTFEKETIKKSLNYLPDCGLGIFQNSTKQNEPSVSIGDWPWMVPLFKKTDLGLQFFCSSTLISYHLVVTAAHCIKYKNLAQIEPKDIVAYVGRFDITNWTEKDSQPREISDSYIHPDFDPYVLHSDLAVLKFCKPVEHTPHVAPACIWQGNDNLSLVVGKKGIVFGWGADGSGNKLTPTPKLAVMPIISQEECLRSKLEFLFLTTNRTFCAGFRNGTGPCSGDSGGGLLIPNRDNNGIIRWYLRGVVSLSLLQDGQIKCDVHEYSVFTDVAKYRDWILRF